jgi:hypothetical protein
MIIYHKLWLNNLRRLNLVEEDFGDGLVPESEWNAVQKACIHGFYSPNLFMRVGLFFLTIVSSLFSSGFLSLLVSSAMDSFGWPLFLGIAHYLALELLVRKNHHYRSGVDDALLWISSGLFTTAFIMATNADDNPLVLSLFIFLVSAVLSIRFSDSLMSLVWYCALLAVVFFGWQKIGPLGNATMPFVMMLVSGISYWLVRKNVDNALFRFYSNSMIVIQVAALISLYAAGNYFIVKELNDILNGTVSKSIPFGWLFWVWTISIPLIYIFFGVKQKNTILLRTGLLLIAAAAATYKAYYKLMPIEYTLIICGALALLISYIITRLLNPPKNGFTTKQLKKDYIMEKLQLESLVISESFADAAIPVEEGFEFGGGEFGGGGSGGGY